MRALLRLGKDKSALSNIVAYVLLIAITVSLSVLVYGWLRFYVSNEEIEACPEGVNIIIRDYQCYLPNAAGGGRLIVTLKNKGLFTVDGYILRVHNRSDATFGVYLFNETGVEIKPGDEREDEYRFDAPEFKRLNDVDYFLNNITLLEVQPFMTDRGEVKCMAYASQEIRCL